MSHELGDRPLAGAALLLAALGLAALVPVTGAPPYPEIESGLLVVVVGYAALAVILLAPALDGGADGEAGAAARAQAGALWTGCGVALILVFLAVEVSSQTMSLRLIVQAQANRLPYVLGQPLAAAIFALAAAAALDPDALAAASLAPALRRVAGAAHLVVFSALGATLFAAGFAGPGLPGPLWVVLKSGAVLAVIVLLRRRLGALAPARLTALVWRLLVPASLANLVATLLVVGL